MSLQITNEELRQKHLFTPVELQEIKLGTLRQRRKQIQDKLKMVSNRISYRKKKEESELRGFLIQQEKSRTISYTRQEKGLSNMIKHQNMQKTMFDMSKRTRQVQNFRITKTRRLTRIYNSVKQRKLQLSQTIRRQKKQAEQTLQNYKQESLSLRKQNHAKIIQMKERSKVRKQSFWLQKKLDVQGRLMRDAQLYERQINSYCRQTLDIKNQDASLRNYEQYAIRTLRTAQQNFGLLRRSQQ